MKKGRFSGKKRANWVLRSSWAASASTWEKSGFTAPENVRLGVMPQRAVRPRSVSRSPDSSPPSGKPSRVSVRWAVRVGSNSMLRPGVAPAKPVILGTWQSRQLSSGSTAIAVIWWRRLRG
jgi:hypothetical protein